MSNCNVLDNEVLVLDKNYLALKLISAKKAFCLLFSNKAETIDVEFNKKFYNYNFNSWREISEFKKQYESHNYSWINLVEGYLAIPPIIRLLGHKYRKQPINLNRKSVYLRDKYTCQYCYKKFNSKSLTLDHVIPKSRNGKTSWDNLVAACFKCNNKKRNRTPKEAGMTLLNDPIKPDKILIAPRSIHKSWEHFVSNAYWYTELQDE